jgi:hypothetical protein
VLCKCSEWKFSYPERIGNKSESLVEENITEAISVTGKITNAR